ncbi:hypothetical protein [Pedobacter sp.]|uniref:hypothetical protein n=1 Tax=Pedobacter sp. TaxID=1411316 RepID=UPI00396CCAC1
MKKNTIILLALILFFKINSYGQVFINNIAGDKIRNTDNYEGILESPYFLDQWVNGEVIFESGNKAKIDYLKYDMMADQLIFTNEKKEAELNFKEPVKAFSLRGLFFQNNFPSYGNYTSKTYYQIIANGKLTLLKKIDVSIGERTRANMPTEKYFKRIPLYFIFKNNSIHDIKISAKTLSEEFGIDIRKVQSIINEGKFNLKNDTDLKKLFEEYLNKE